VSVGLESERVRAALLHQHPSTTFHDSHFRSHLGSRLSLLALAPIVHAARALSLCTQLLSRMAAPRGGVTLDQATLHADWATSGLILKRYHGQLTEMGAAIVAECDKSNAEKIAFATKRAQLDAETTAIATERAQLVADKLAMATDQTFVLQFYNTIVAREIAVVEHERPVGAEKQLSC
jgi:hypothetical protein